MTTLSEMSAQNARLYPDVIALTELKPSQKTRKEITWKQFDERANRKLDNGNHFE